MKTHRQSPLQFELAFYGYEASPDVRQAELRQWTVYLPDLLPAILQASEND